MRSHFKLIIACAFSLNLIPALAQQVRVLVQSSPLAGYQFHEGASLWPSLKVGDVVILKRETDNRHDTNAIRVEWQGHMLGYLPRKENLAVAAEMDRGSRLDAKIGRLKDTSDPWQRILIDVYIAF